MGSNLDQPADKCREAMGHLAALEHSRLIRVSSLYRTEPLGIADQDWFVNAVAEIRTTLPPRDLLSALLHIESLMGRVRAGRWGPRVIDLDLLLYGQSVIDEPGLTVPHPELHKRRFVLVPLNEIAPYAVHPVFGISVRGLLDRLAGSGGKVEFLGGTPARITENGKERDG
ncbi:MAG TPA: 2-amino-4-hydroxy-6-hydroxymethyldihydropteridine diphosphokinase [Syntrophales bacterium]|nr:2-amino-4-hydroxy-6-hydroxymethyldihydropteridine diphosphokinase [Syntrophales bacterium]HQQ27325.1 2-amino-4-hydroxy-6-hydroxymethyldihydropteridine diphosphokinase [Syntrophales bacterium]